MCATVSLKKKKTSDGSLVNPTAEEKVNVANNVLYAMFRDQFISVNGRQVQSSYQCFHIASYLTLLLNMAPQSLDKWGSTGYYDDTNLSQTNPTPESGGCDNVKRRYLRFSEGKSVELR